MIGGSESDVDKETTISKCRPAVSHTMAITGPGGWIALFIN
jgi:hypothetical protein